MRLDRKSLELVNVIVDNQNPSDIQGILSKRTFCPISVPNSKDLGNRLMEAYMIYVATISVFHCFVFQVIDRLRL